MKNSMYLRRTEEIINASRYMNIYYEYEKGGQPFHIIRVCKSPECAALKSKSSLFKIYSCDFYGSLSSIYFLHGLSPLPIPSTSFIIYLVLFMSGRFIFAIQIKATKCWRGVNNTVSVILHKPLKNTPLLFTNLVFY